MASETSPHARHSRLALTGLRLRRVRHATEADPQTVKLTLFRDKDQRVCGWYIGPLAITSEGVEMAYLAQSTETIASLAIVRAIEAADAARTEVCVIDPDDLWGPAWTID